MVRRRKRSPGSIERHVFHGRDADPDSPAWKALLPLARRGVQLAAQHGMIPPPAPPAGKRARDWYWIKTWMNLVHEEIRKRRPEWITEVSSPDGVTCSALQVPIFAASAYVAERLAEDAAGK
jgi:hypothetical protein